MKIKRLTRKIRRKGLEWGAGYEWREGWVRGWASEKGGGRTWPKGLIVQESRG